jgi:hypothetical protein
MLKLPQVTLIALTGKDIMPHMEAIQKSCEGIEWGDVKLVYQPTIKSIDDWNKAVIYELHTYIRTDFAMLIHADGYVINPEAWQDEFLAYDYIGAPWPLPRDNYSYRTPTGELVRVGNSVSLRSKRILELPSQLGLEWKSYYGNTNEDGFLCVHNERRLRESGCTFAPIEVAKHFSKEHEIPENQGIETFAFHTVDQ